MSAQLSRHHRPDVERDLLTQLADPDHVMRLVTRVLTEPSFRQRAASGWIRSFRSTWPTR